MCFPSPSLLCGSCSILLAKPRNYNSVSSHPWVRTMVCKQLLTTGNSFLPISPEWILQMPESTIFHARDLIVYWSNTNFMVPYRVQCSVHVSACFQGSRKGLDACSHSIINILKFYVLWDDIREAVGRQ